MTTAPMTFEAYEREVERVYHVVPNWRWGQAYFNVLYLYRPDLSEKVRGTDLDPFHLNHAPYEFLEFVRESW